MTLTRKPGVTFAAEPQSRGYICRCPKKVAGATLAAARVGELTPRVYMVAGFSDASRSQLFGSIAGQQAVLWRLAEGVKQVMQDTVPASLAR